MNMEGVAALILRYRRVRGLSHKQLADKAGMTAATLSRRMADPGAFRAAELIKIFRALGVPEEERVIDL